MRNNKGSTPLSCAVIEFVAHQRVFGRSYWYQEYILKALDRFASRRGARDLNASLFDAWCKSQGHLSPTTLHGRQLVVRKLCLFRRRTDSRCFVPDPTGFARPRPHAPPVIVTPSQVADMLRAADQLRASRDSPHRAATMRIAVVLLYTAGLRRGELLRLRLADVDADDGVLHIRESKFHRSRWVPLSSDARRELREYLRNRMGKPYDVQPRAPLLCNASRAYGHVGWHAYCGGGLTYGIRTLFDQAGGRDAQ